MFLSDCYLGCPKGLCKILAIQEDLKTKVAEQVNDSQELMMMNTFTKESHEYRLKKCLQERLCEIASWRWVLNDLSKRLDEALVSLRYEHNALRVVVERVQDEIDGHSEAATRPGALCPMSDAVEEVVIEEYKFLKEQKKKFEKLISELEKQIAIVEKTKKRIENDVLSKEKTIDIEEQWSGDGVTVTRGHETTDKRKKKYSPITRWEHKCSSLKTAGLQALGNAIIIRQQVRGSRVQLSVSAQAHASRVDSAIRRRLHANSIKLDELKWQREETIRDLQVLEEERATTEQSLVDNVERVKQIEATIAERNLRPPGELTKDEVDRSLREELGRLKRFSKVLKENKERINGLRKTLETSIIRIDNIAEDIGQVISLDTYRIHSRQDDQPPTERNAKQNAAYIPNRPDVTSLNMVAPAPQTPETEEMLPTIKEESDEDDYPFDF